MDTMADFDSEVRFHLCTRVTVTNMYSYVQISADCRRFGRSLLIAFRGAPFSNFAGIQRRRRSYTFSVQYRVLYVRLTRKQSVAANFVKPVGNFRRIVSLKNETF